LVNIFSQNGKIKNTSVSSFLYFPLSFLPFVPPSSTSSLKGLRALGLDGLGGSRSDLITLGALEDEPPEGKKQRKKTRDE